MKHVWFAALPLLLACSHRDTPPLPPPTAAEPASGTTAASDPPRTSPSAIASSETATPVAEARGTSAVFAQHLFGQMRKEKGNFSLAAGNVREALIAVAIGAKASTADELGKVLGTGASPAELAAEAKVDRAVWQNAMGDATLVAAARIWHDAAQKLLPDYVTRNNEALGAAPQAVNFVGNAEGARGAINEWAKEKTAGKIPELLSPGAVDARTRLVATTALYFKASWSSAFNESLTTPDPFFALGSKAAKKVPTMHKRGQFRAKGTGDFVAVDMPYSKSGLAMLVAMPTGTTTLATLEERYTQSGIASLQEGLEMGQVDLSLPKFTFRSGGSISPALKALGLKEAFTDKANFSGMFGSNGVQLSDVIHRTFIAVDEKGTEAAAASAAVVSIKSMPLGKPTEIKVDHPFLFLIHDASGHVLFAGRVADPIVTP